VPALQDDNDELDAKLRQAGDRWRRGHAFEHVVVPTELFKRTAHEHASPARMRGAFDLVMVAAVVLAVMILGPMGPGLSMTGGEGSSAPASAQPPDDGRSTPGPNVAATQATTDSEAVRQAVIAAVMSDPTNFGGVYIERDGTLVIQSRGQGAARAAVEAMLIPGIPVRWEEVERSRSDLLRVAEQIRDRNIPGVFGIAVDTIHNQVAVSVGPTGSLSVVEATLSADYGPAVAVVFSTDILVIRPGTASPEP
jgi:hypothetical protein